MTTYWQIYVDKTDYQGVGGCRITLAFFFTAEFSNIPHAYYKPPFINYLNTGLGDKSREDIWQDVG